MKTEYEWTILIHDMFKKLKLEYPELTVEKFTELGAKVTAHGSNTPEKMNFYEVMDRIKEELKKETDKIVEAMMNHIWDLLKIEFPNATFNDFLFVCRAKVEPKIMSLGTMSGEDIYNEVRKVFLQAGFKSIMKEAK